MAVAVKLLLLIMVTGLLALYTNCDGYKRHEISSEFVLGDPRDINNFKEVPPAVICGKSGWEFMLRNYVKHNCGACHYSGGFAGIPFASDNLDQAYNFSKTITRARWIATVTDNQFCGPNCNLSRTGQMFNGLMQWVDNQYGCP